MNNKEELKVVITADASKFKTEINNTENSLEDLGKNSEASLAKFTDAVDKAKEKVKKGLEITAGAVAAVGTAFVGLVESTDDWRSNNDKLIAAFETAGGTADDAAKAYDRLFRAFGDDTTATETAIVLSTLTTNQQELAEWTTICEGVYSTFGDAIPLSQLAEAATETANTGEVVGGLSDALEWAGVSAESFSKELEKCTTKSEREKKIREKLNGLYKTAATRYEKASAGSFKANEAQNKLNKTMAKAAWTVEPAVNGFKELGATILEKAQKPLKKITSFFTEGLLPAIKKVIDFASKNSTTIITAISGITGAVVAYKLASAAAKAADEGWTIATMAQVAAQKLLNAVMAVTPWGWVAIVAGAAVGAIGAYALASGDAAGKAGELTEEQKKLCEEIQATNEEIKEQQSKTQDICNDYGKVGEKHKELAKELENLVDANGKVKSGEEERAKFILNELSEAYGEEYGDISNIIDQNGKLKDSVLKVIEVKTAEAMLQAHRADYIKAIEDETSAYDALAKANDEVVQQKQKVAEAQAAVTQAHQDYLDAQEKGDYSTRWAVIEGQKIQDLEAEREKLETLTTAYNTQAETYGLTRNEIMAYEEASVAVQEGNTQRVKDLYSSRSEYVSDYIKDLDTNSQESIKILEKEAVDAKIEAERIKKNFEDGVAGYTEGMVREANEGYEKAMAAYNTAYADATKVGNNIGDGLKNGIVNKEGYVQGEGRGLLSRLIDTMREAADSHSPSRKTNSLGQDIGQGLINGMEDKRGSIFAKARNLVSGLIQEMKRTADSHSPSKKTMQLGLDIGEGTEIGIDKSTNDVVRSAQLMINKALNPIMTSVELFGEAKFTKSVSFSATSGSINTNSNKELIKGLSSVLAGNNQPIILQVDGKTFGKIVCNSINNLTKQTGSLPLILQ